MKRGGPTAAPHNRSRTDPCSVLLLALRGGGARRGRPVAEGESCLEVELLICSALRGEDASLLPLEVERLVDRRVELLDSCSAAGQGRDLNGQRVAVLAAAG